MKKCPECAELVQDEARVCRFCRHEFALSGTKVLKVADTKPQEDQNKGLLVALCVGIILLLSAVSRCGGGSSDEVPNENVTSESAKTSTAAKPKKPASPYADTGKQIAWVSAGKVSIKEQLKDPDSATFRNVHFYSGGGTPVVCGEVNAKNAFGGYTGFERFVAAGSVIAATESQVEGGLGPVWSKFCVKSPVDQI